MEPLIIIAIVLGVVLLPTGIGLRVWSEHTRLEGPIRLARGETTGEMFVRILSVVLISVGGSLLLVGIAGTCVLLLVKLG